MTVIFLKKKDITKKFKIKIFFILCAKMHHTSFKSHEEDSWRVKDNRVESLTSFCQAQSTSTGRIRDYVYPNFSPRTAGDFMVASEERSGQARGIISQQIFSGSPQTSFANAVVELYHNNNHAVLPASTFDFEGNLILNSTKDNFTVENIPLLFNAGDTTGSTQLSFQCISLDLQKQLKNLEFKPHENYLSTPSFNIMRGEGLKCVTLEASEIGLGWRLSTVPHEIQGSSVYNDFLARQDEAPTFLFEKLQSCFSGENVILILYIINLSSKAIELVAYSLQPFLLALIGPQNFFSLYFEIFARHSNGLFITSIFFSLLQSLETNKLGKTLEGIREWMSLNEIANSATVKALVYRIQIFTTEKESGIRHVVISQGDSSKTFLTVLERFFNPENFFPYFYTNVSVSNSIEAMQVFEETVRYAGI